MEKILGWGFKYWDCEQLNPTPGPDKPAKRIPKTKERKAGRRSNGNWNFLRCRVREWDLALEGTGWNTRGSLNPQNQGIPGTRSSFLHRSVWWGGMAFFVSPVTFLPAAAPSNSHFQHLCKAPSVKLGQSLPKIQAPCTATHTP